MSENSKTAKMHGFGAILSHVEFQTGPYKTSHSNKQTTDKQKSVTYRLDLEMVDLKLNSEGTRTGKI